MLINFLKLGIVMMILAVIIGAFGAHGLEQILIENNMVYTFETESKYHFYYGLGLIFLGIIVLKYESKKLKVVWIFFFVGIFIFSGSLCVLSVTNVTWLGAITPIGGLFFILGWIFFLLSLKDISAQKLV